MHIKLQTVCIYCFLFCFVLPVPTMALQAQQPCITYAEKESLGGSSDGSSGGSLDGSSGGSLDGSLGGSSGGSLDGSLGGSSGGSLGGSPDGSSDGSLGGSSGGSLDGSLGGSSGGSLDGSSGGSLDGSLGGSSGGSPDTSLGGSSGGSPDGSLDGSPDGSLGGSSGGSSDGSLGDSSGGSLDGSLGGSSGGSSDTSLGGSSGGSLDGSSGGSPDGSLGGSSGGFPDGSLGGSPDGSLGGSSDTPDTPEIPQYTITLSQKDIPTEGTLSFTTIYYTFSDEWISEGLYPGKLTIEITEPITIPSGVSVSIATLSIGGTEERPCIKGNLSSTSLITIQEGGALHFGSVDFDLSGQGIFLTRETGASLTYHDTTIPENSLLDAPPIVDHINQAPADIFLPEGTILESSILPASLRTYVQEDGVSTIQNVAIQWDFAPYDGRTSGTITLTGTFLDANGTPMTSLIPLEITIHWYQPEILPIQKIQWKGNESVSVTFTLPPLSETFQKVWCEISTDQQKTWVPASLVLEQTDTDGSMLYVFSVPSGTAYHCRLAAMDTAGRILYSNSVQRTQEGDDTEGNRGGATTPNPPDRQPTFSPDTEPEIPEQTEVSADDAQTAPNTMEQKTESNTIDHISVGVTPVRHQTIAQTPDYTQNNTAFSIPQSDTTPQTKYTESDYTNTMPKNDHTLPSVQNTDTAPEIETQQSAQAMTQDRDQIDQIDQINQNNQKTENKTTYTNNTETTPSVAWKQGIWIGIGCLVCVAFAIGLTHLFRKHK